MYMHHLEDKHDHGCIYPHGGQQNTASNVGRHLDPSKVFLCIIHFNTTQYDPTQDQRYCIHVPIVASLQWKARTELY